MDCCAENQPEKKKPDYLLIVSSAIIAVCYMLVLFHVNFDGVLNQLTVFSTSAYELMNRMWWGLVLGILFVGLLGEIPRDFIMSIFGRHAGLQGILRATVAGLLLDLCSHGILLVGMKLYERGVSLGQVMAFLIASPWNSLSLTIILVSLVGLYWTLVFIILSAVIAIASGLIFQLLVKRGVLPENPYAKDASNDFHFWSQLKSHFKNRTWNKKFFSRVFVGGIKESRMILRWIFFGVVMASLVRTFVDTDVFQTYFGPSPIGLLLTLIAATIIEVCSEGSTPIAADLVLRAHAPGNGFAFLMTGVSTDYTEIMSLKERTKSWKIALFLPLVTVPQVIAISLLINYFSK